MTRCWPHLDCDDIRTLEQLVNQGFRDRQARTLVYLLGQGLDRLWLRGGRLLLDLRRSRFYNSQRHLRFLDSLSTLPRVV